MGGLGLAAGGAETRKLPWSGVTFDGAGTHRIRGLVPMRYTRLGPDGFGRSGTRASLRRHFGVDRYCIAQAAIDALAKEGKMTTKDVSRAIKLYKIDAEKGNPVGV